MSKRRIIRIVIEIFVSLAFISSVGFALLHAYGFRYDIVERAFVKRTIVDLPVDLEDVYITFDGVYVADKTPYQIFNVKPGRHNLKVEKEGYYTWEENFKAQEDIVSSFGDIFIFPTDMEKLKTVVLAGESLGEFTIQGGEVFLLKDGEKNQKLDLKTGEFSEVAANQLIQENLELKKNEDDVRNFVANVLPIATIKQLNLLYHPAINKKIVYLSFTNGSKGIYEITNQALRLIDEVDLSLFDYTDSGRQLLYTNGFDVKVYDVLEDKVKLVSRFSQKLNLLQWYEDSYFVYGTPKSVNACDQPLKHCVPLWNVTEANSEIKNLEYLPSENSWIVIRSQEVAVYK